VKGDFQTGELNQDCGGAPGKFHTIEEKDIVSLSRKGGKKLHYKPMDAWWKNQRTPKGR